MSIVTDETEVGQLNDLRCIKDIANYNCPQKNKKKTVLCQIVKNGRPGTCRPLMDGISLDNNVPSSFI